MATAITLDATSSHSYKPGGTLSWNHTVGSGNNRYLIVATFATRSMSPPYNLYYNGVQLRPSLGFSPLDDHSINIQLYGLVNPVSGTHTISATLSPYGPTAFIAVASSWSNVLQTNPYDIVYGPSPFPNLDIQTGVVTGDSVSCVPGSAMSLGQIGLAICAWVDVLTPPSVSSYQVNGYETVCLDSTDSGGTLYGLETELVGSDGLSFGFNGSVQYITVFLRLNGTNPNVTIGMQGSSAMLEQVATQLPIVMQGRSAMTIRPGLGLYIVQVFDDQGTLLAQSDPTLPGSIICNPVGESGPTFTANASTLTPLSPGIALIDIRWPASYDIYFTTDTIDYSQPNDTKSDNGGSTFEYLTDDLDTGTYNWNVISVDDEGKQQTSPLSQTPEVVKVPPAAPTILSVEQTSPMNFNITISAAGGTTNTIYFSEVNRPVNFGNLSAPTPVTLAEGVTSGAITIPAFSQEDRTTAYTTLANAWDAAVALCNKSFTCVGFLTMAESCIVALNTFQQSIGQPLLGKRTALTAAAHSTYSSIYYSSVGYLIYYQKFLSFLGNILESNPSRYVSSTDLPLPSSIYDICQPFVRENYISIIVRSTLNGVEDQNTTVYHLQIDSSGNSISPIPSDAILSEYDLVTVSGQVQLTVKASLQDGNNAPATICDLYVLAASAYPTESIDLTSPTQSKDFVTGFIPVLKHVTFDAVNVSTGTWYMIAVVGRTDAGARSKGYQIKLVYVAADTPVAPSNIEAELVNE